MTEWNDHLWIWVALLAFFLVTTIARYLYLARTIALLKRLDVMQWTNLGCPKPFLTGFLIELLSGRYGRDFTTLSPRQRPLTIKNIGTEYTDLYQWLRARHYERTNNPEIAKAGARYRQLGNAQFIVGGAFFCLLLFTK